MSRLVLLAVTLLGLAGLLGCQSGSGPSAAPETVPGSGRAISVPADEPTIQAAVDHARPGDLVLLSQGVYSEAVDVHTASIVIRGVDRNGVVLDGRGRLDHGIWLVADGIAVENLTVRNYVDSGVVVGRGPTGQDSGPPPGQVGSSVDVTESSMEPTTGYRVSYVTSSGNDHAGIHVLGATGGLIEHTLTWGNGDAGFAIVGCSPCRSVVTNSEASHNSTGFAATDAGGDLFVVGSTFRQNRVGVALTNADDADRTPQGDTVVAANLVVDNDDLRTPQTATGGFGVGIVVGGGRGNRIERNRVSGHDGVGIALTDTRGSAPRDNTVRANVLQANRTDLAIFLVTSEPSAAEGNCFAANEASSTVPPDIERLLPCGDDLKLPESLPPPTLPAAPNGVPPAALPPPGDQPSMPNAVGAPAVPADHLLPHIDVDALAVPPAASS